MAHLCSLMPRRTLQRRPSSTLTSSWLRNRASQLRRPRARGEKPREYEIFSS